MTGPDTAAGIPTSRPRTAPASSSRGPRRTSSALISRQVWADGHRPTHDRRFRRHQDVVRHTIRGRSTTAPDRHLPHRTPTARPNSQACAPNSTAERRRRERSRKRTSRVARRRPSLRDRFKNDRPRAVGRSYIRGGHRALATLRWTNDRSWRRTREARGRERWGRLRRRCRVRRRTRPPVRGRGGRASSGCCRCGS